mmetsp:Transcript_23321/g.47469  ORF Transcript_23321/g.47469 Transcript_23321/m.47469 type:complete len:212 (+) Transcript_23321:221-856(+)
MGRLKTVRVKPPTAAGTSRVATPERPMADHSSTWLSPGTTLHERILSSFGYFAAAALPCETRAPCNPPVSGYPLAWKFFATCSNTSTSVICPSVVSCNALPRLAPLGERATKRWHERELAPAPANDKVPPLNLTRFFSSGILLFCHLACTCGSAATPNCTRKPGMTRYSSMSVKKPLVTSSKKRSTPRGEFERSTTAVKDPAVVTHFTLVV